MNVIEALNILFIITSQAIYRGSPLQRKFGREKSVRCKAIKVLVIKEKDTYEWEGKARRKYKFKRTLYYVF